MAQFLCDLFVVISICRLSTVGCRLSSRVVSCQTTPRTSWNQNSKSNSIGNPKAAGNNLKITFVQKRATFLWRSRAVWV